MGTTTLRELNGFDETPASLADATVILIDYQNTYTGGVMELDGYAEAIAEGKKLLAAAREAGAPVIHVQEAGYDTNSEGGRIHPDVAPIEGEAVVVKSVPNAYHNTDLGELVENTGRKDVILAGFMTNMCVLFTAQGAFLRGDRPTVVASACATRSLPTAKAAGTTLSAQQIHDGALATITELYGVVAPSVSDLK
ncbi:isochorismatase [Streptomyces filipinensis]|uniref:Isochorismatase n=1 Tax=Streptomyces filipinensis TaxID=66887 RepID=A0A918MEG8_9ACTN|nr:cysteine hydrolase family protein [Streptomyces filipinensis]GGV13286.1 isochorismatase [Streptomyces filipinensis]